MPGKVQYEVITVDRILLQDGGTIEGGTYVAVPPIEDAEPLSTLKINAAGDGVEWVAPETP